MLEHANHTTKKSLFVLPTYLHFCMLPLYFLNHRSVGVSLCYPVLVCAVVCALTLPNKATYAYS